MSDNESKSVEVMEPEVTECETSSAKKKASELWSKASSMSKKVADNVQKNAVALSEKAKAEYLQRRLEKYNPLFAKEYRSKGFAFPSLIKLVENSAIQSIDVCDGAIGWREKSGDVEVLFLSVDFAANCGLTFFPAAVPNALFCTETYSPQNYVNVDRVFSKAHEEKLAELEHIAFSLGAKSCSIELVESEESSSSTSRDGQFSIKMVKGSANDKSKQASGHSMSGRTITTFKGSDSPIRPTLKWFQNDHSILNLIEMRCSDKNAIESRQLILEGSSSMTMEQNKALGIDAIISKIGMKLRVSMESQHQRECSSKLIYEVIF